MDPQQALKDLLTAIAMQEWDLVEANAENLAVWVARGGHAPTLVSEIKDNTTFAFRVPS